MTTGRGMSRRIGFSKYASGSAAVEFGLVFPLLFLVMYSAIVYGYVYTLQQTINLAAQEGARAAVAVVPDGTTDATTTQQNNAAAAISSATSWLPSNQLAALKTSYPTPTSPCPSTCFDVEVTFSLTEPVLFPVFTLPIVGTFPVLPASLIAQAVVQTS